VCLLGGGLSIWEIFRSERSSGRFGPSGIAHPKPGKKNCLRFCFFKVRLVVAVLYQQDIDGPPGSKAINYYKKRPLKI
jgi:hypothetical protein